MSPELRLLLAGILTGAALTVALEVVGLLWLMGRKEDAELRGSLQGGWLDPAPACPPPPARRTR